MLGFTYRKTKRGSVIKVRYSSLEQHGQENRNQQHPRHLTKVSKTQLGNYVTNLADSEDIETENEVLLLKHDVPHLEFSDSVLACLPPEGSNWTIPEDEFSRREDLRHMNVCSVDPPGCTDIDDALHYVDLNKDTCEVGVHIADVSYYVKPDTALDREAANRGTTVYLSDRRIDMIPELLSSNLCSLIEQKDRLAFSVIWKIKKSNAEVLDVRFLRSIIRSKASLTYEKAQTMIDDTTNKSPIHESLRGLNKLAKKLKKKRMDRGALVLARADEIRFVETESETCERDLSFEIQHKKMVDTNSMIEEFMLLANIAVANKLLSSFPHQALLRRHPQPSKADFQDLIESARMRGFEIKPDDGKSLSESLDRAKLPNDDFFNLMLRMIATRCMTPAAYFCSGYFNPQETSFTHFGLAADLYTHFTSPIRRYADLLVHRLLAHSIGSADIDKTLTKSNSIQLLCDKINYRHRQAQLASRASARLHTILYIRSRPNLVEEAHVFFVRQNAIQILIPRIAFEYTYFLPSNKSWQYDVEQKCHHNAEKNISLRQFDKLQVHISKNDSRHSDRIQVRIIQPAIDDIESGDDTAMKAEILQDKDDDVQMAIDESERELSLLEDVDKSGFLYKQAKRKIRIDLSESENSRPVIVMPGDNLDKYITHEMTTMLGPGLMRFDDKVVATKSGILKMRNSNLFWVDCHQRRYVAARGDCVIGIVQSKASMHVTVDINSADPASLSLLAFEGANKRMKPNLNVGDLVYAKVLSASKHIETELVCVNSNGKKDGLGQIGEKGGFLLNLSIDTIRVLLSTKCDLLERLGQVHRYEIAVGMNGRVWINATERSTLVQVATELHKFDIN